MGQKIERGSFQVISARSTGDPTNLTLDMIRMHHCGTGPPPTLLQRSLIWLQLPSGTFPRQAFQPGTLTKMLGKEG